jgi:hypothetical protein
LQFELTFEFKALPGYNLADFGLPDTHSEKGFNYDPFGANDNDGIFTRAAMTEDGLGCGTSAVTPTFRACIRVKPSPIPGEQPRFWMNQLMARVKYEQFSTVYDLGYFHTVSGICCPLPQALKNKAAEFRNLFFEEELTLTEPIQCDPFQAKLSGHLFVSRTALANAASAPVLWDNFRVAEFSLTISNPEKVADYTNFVSAERTWARSAWAHWEYSLASASDHPWVPNGRISGGLFNPPDTPPNKAGESMVGLCPSLLNNSEPVDYLVNLEWEDKIVPGVIKPEIAAGLSFVCSGKTNYIQHLDQNGANASCEENFAPFTTGNSYGNWESAYYNTLKTATVCNPPHDPFNDPFFHYTGLELEQEINARREPIIFGKMTNQKDWGWDVGYIWCDHNIATDNQGHPIGTPGAVGAVAVECNPFKMTITGMPVLYTRYQVTPILVGHFKATITLAPGWTKPGECHPQKYGALWWKYGNSCIQSNSHPGGWLSGPITGPFETFKDCIAAGANPIDPVLLPPPPPPPPDSIDQIQSRAVQIKPRAAGPLGNQERFWLPCIHKGPEIPGSGFT